MTRWVLVSVDDTDEDFEDWMIDNLTEAIEQSEAPAHVVDDNFEPGHG